MNKRLEFPVSPRQKRLEDLCKKFNSNDVLRRIPERLNPNIEFSEDEDDEVDESYSKTGNSFSDSESTVVYNESSNIYTCKQIDSADQAQLCCSDDREREHTCRDNYDESRDMFSKHKAVESSDNLKILESMFKSTDFTLGEKKIFSVKKETLKHSSLREDLYSSEDNMAVNGNGFSVLSLLGTGGSCKVFSAVNQKTKDIVAIKHVNLCDADEVTKTGFMREIEFLKMLQGSDHVVHMFDYEFRATMLLIVLEKGDTDLAHLIHEERKKNNLTSIMIKFYWSQMLTAVSEIHSFGIVHADLKPANFLLVSGHLKLIDFGIAASVPKDQTSVFRENNIGTVNYMSPEAIGSQSINDKVVYKVGVKADVWSLGCILYDMVYGYTPFGKLKSIFSKVRSITDPLYQISYPVENQDRLLVDALKKCLVWDPRKRTGIEDLVNHPYLTCLVDHIVPVGKDNMNELFTQIRSLTPQNQQLISRMVKELTLANQT